MARTARQDARRSGKEDAEHTFSEDCLFVLDAEHNNEYRKGVF